MSRILIETVGVGQSELDIARTADTSVVVLVPESGDSIQTLKAGLMEIADIFVVNKADRPGADRLRHELELMLGLRSGNTLKNVPAHHGVDLRRPLTPDEKLAMNPARAAREATRNDGDVMDATRPAYGRGEGRRRHELVEAVDRHFGYLERSGALRERRRARFRERVVEVVEGGCASVSGPTTQRTIGSTTDSPSWRAARRIRSPSPTSCSSGARTF